MNRTNFTPQQIVDKAEAFDVEAWLQEATEDEDYYPPERGPWPEGSREQRISLPYEHTGKPEPSIAIGLIPAANAWEAPAHVRYGGWNECPGDVVHVAIHKKWHLEYGATIVCMSHDVIECTVERPPTTREAALKLAQEQYTYCSDIVTQGTQTLDELAAHLLDGRAWFFWWD